MAKNIFDDTIRNKEKIRDDLINKHKRELNKTLRGNKYKIDNLLSRTSLGNKYHDLIDENDKINSEYQRKFNQAYHSIDVELYKLNRKLDNNSKIINDKINRKKEQLFS